jgi:pullulanase
MRPRVPGSARGWMSAVFALVLSLLLAACGGGSGESAGGRVSPLAAEGAGLVSALESLQIKQPQLGANVCNATDFATVLSAVPPTVGDPPSGMVKVHYYRADGNYTDYGLHLWQINASNAYIADYPGVSWGTPYPQAGVDDYGAYWLIDASVFRSDAAGFGFIVHKANQDGDPPGVDRFWQWTDGDELWLKSGEATVYRTNPFSGALDLNSVRVHYQRYDGNYADWGLHLWDTNGMDTSRTPGIVIGVWEQPVAFSAMPNYAAAAGSIVFDIPVLNPKDDSSRKQLEFIIHGMPTNANGGVNNKDGWTDNIRVDYANLKVANGIGEVWLVQETPTVFYSAPDLRQASTTDARAYWLDSRLIKWPGANTTGQYKLYYSGAAQIVARKDGAVTGADGWLPLSVFTGTIPPLLAERFKYVPAGTVLSLDRAVAATVGRKLAALQLVVVQENDAGQVQNATTAQIPGALDDLFSAAKAVPDLGVKSDESSVRFKLWAPSAQRVHLCVYASGSSNASSITEMTMAPNTGVWSTTKGPNVAGKYYKYAVQTFVRGVGVVRNLVTDPYSVSLTTDSKRSYVANLDAPSLKPSGWDAQAAPVVPAQEDMVIYELHVRDFSINDTSVPAADRGKYQAFTHGNSNGMRHLRALGQAGLTDIHLLPVFDLASIPEAGCVNPVIPNAAPDSPDQQAAVNAVRDTDCFNWGYDPFHYTAPEGSYASDPADGAKRIFEFRQMVKSLHAAGLRVGMDVVYNHTSASGQTEKSVLDRVVPGYYHRLNGNGEIERSTCCENTATENMMMGKLMIDSVVTWATAYRIDSFRFDLMAHQPRSVMEELKASVNTATGRDIFLVGEGWNFGEVADGARFVQASQLSLNGSGIGTFSDRARDAVRGGGPFDSGTSLIANQGYINGMFYDNNGGGGTPTADDLKRTADMVRVGLAGSIRSYPMTTYQDASVTLEQIDYNGQPAGYVTDPQEVVNYVENHDNQTLFDINVYKLPTATSTEDRARVQMLGAAINAFSQGVTYYHAGIDTLRSKSMDRNSYNSGDWFNRLDWTYTDNYYATGLPPEGDNGANWSVIQPLLANPAIKPSGTDIALARDMFRDLLQIRSSSTLFRLRSADDVKARLSFPNTGSAQNPVVQAGHLDGNGYAGANFREVLYFVNVDKVAQQITLPGEKSKSYVLHPTHLAAADRRAANDARYDAASGAFTIPPRSAVVYVVN